MWLTTANEPWAFFSLPTRAWELGLGALLAVGAGRLARLPALAATTAGWLGLGLIAAGGLLIDTSTPFPGLAALLPTVGCALAMLPGMVGRDSLPVRLLGWAPARFMGRISYSLYLWHWPLLVLPLAVAGGSLPLVARVGLMVLAVPIAYASQRWLEDPIRHGRIVGIVPGRNLALAGAVSLAVATTSLGLGFVTTQRLAAATADVADPGGSSAAAAGDEPIPDLAAGSPSPLADTAPAAGWARSRRTHAVARGRSQRPADDLRRRMPPRPAVDRHPRLRLRRPGIIHDGRPVRRFARGRVVPGPRPAGSRPGLAARLADQERLHTRGDDDLEHGFQATL